MKTATKPPKRPHVVCHMVPSVDGRIVTSRWGLSAKALAEYDRPAPTYKADAWMAGRISMAPYAGSAKVPARKSSAPVPRTDFIAPHGAKSFAVALDPSGKLAWEKSTIDDEHVVTVLTEQVSDDYLAFLQARGVSYVFGGATEVDLARVIVTLRRAFQIRTLLLEGGGSINGSFLAADLVDEVSVLVAPIVDGSIGVPTLFDGKSDEGPVRALKLVSFEKRAGGLMWLRYKVKR